MLPQRKIKKLIPVISKVAYYKKMNKNIEYGQKNNWQIC
jgi:hypothetical protein